MKIIITVIRMAIGWHFLYEGCVKLFADGWTSEGYLAGAQGFLSGFFHWLAASQGRLEIVDFLNIAGLILIGLSLSFGLFGKLASIAGAFLLTLYYLAYPAFGISLLNSTEGSVFIINKLLIEALVLVFLFVNKENGYGLSGLTTRLYKRKKIRAEDAARVPEQLTLHENTSRREALKNLATIPILGAIGWGAYRNTKKYGIDVMSGAT
ncbi:MAG: DoxX family membrane protein, partial [Tannerella sp.]|nr:DoxX family membrane protein [Tannerella sp.]